MWDYITNVSNVLALLGGMGTLLGSFFAYKQWRIIRHTEHVKFYSESYRQVEEVKSLIEWSGEVPDKAINEIKKAHEYAKLHLNDDIVAYIEELKKDVLKLWQYEKEFAERKGGEMNEADEAKRFSLVEEVSKVKAKIMAVREQNELYQKYTKLK